MNDMLHNMSTADNMSVCANCGKEGSDVTNICNKCKQVKYCNAACKKKHRHKHKKDCEKRVAELHDIELFKQPPPLHEDCPICFLRLSFLGTGQRYQTCCGKVICSGCLYAPLYDNQGNQVDNKTCAFCRTPEPASNEEVLERMKKRIEAGDAYATYDLGCCHRNGERGYTQDYIKAIELWHQAAELGFALSYYNIGCCYDNGRGVEIDKKKAVHYYELAAIGGDSRARCNLGYMEENAGNIDRALKHYMIAVRGGHAPLLDSIKQLYTNGHATKDDYTKALQLYQAYLGEIKSSQRDKAAAAREDYRYY